MPATKISALTAGGASQATDEYVVARAGDNRKITGADVAAAATSLGIVARLQAASGTITANTPVLDLTQTWNNSGVTFTGMVFNVTDTASNAASLLMDLQVGGSSRFSVRKDGRVSVTGGTSGGISTTAGGGSGLLFVAGSGVAGLEGNGRIQLDPGGCFAWVPSFGNVFQTFDLALFRDAANTLAQRNGVNAQTFRLYNTFTDASNYERGKLEWASNVLRIGTEKLGTGTARALELQTDGTTRVTVAATTGNITATGDVLTIGGANNNGLSSASFGLYLRALGTDTTLVTTSSFQLATNQRLTFGAADDLHLHRDAADQLAQRRTTNAQTFNIYNTFTSATNYERLSIAATAAGAVRIRTNKGSGGGTARALELGTDDTTRVTIPTTGGCVVGTAALATNATDGFLYVPTCAGTPTGTPTAQTGTVPIVVDTTNNKLYFYSGAAWRDAGP